MTEVPNTFCSSCVSNPCEGICKIPAPEYCDDCGGECDGCCKKYRLRPHPQAAKESVEDEKDKLDKLEQDLKYILTNSDTYVKMFLIRLKEELQRRSSK